MFFKSPFKFSNICSIAIHYFSESPMWHSINLEKLAFYFSREDLCASFLKWTKFKWWFRTSKFHTYRTWSTRIGISKLQQCEPFHEPDIFHTMDCYVRVIGIKIAFESSQMLLWIFVSMWGQGFVLIKTVCGASFFDCYIDGTLYDALIWNEQDCLDIYALCSLWLQPI